jgi:hypothetical protein
MGKWLCEEEGWSKGARAGGTPHCIAHGGGKRCQHEGCTKSARGDTEHCKAHGGGRRCQHDGCLTAAATGGTPICKAHGGGKRCQHAGCTKSLEATRRIASRTVVAGVASTRAAPSRL